MKNNGNLMSSVSRKKLYKAKKNWLVATAVTVGVAGGALLATSNVNADPVSPASSQAPTVQVQNNQQSPTIQQVQAQLNNNQQRLNSANAALASQQAQKSEADNALNQAQANANSATEHQNVAQTSASEASTAVDQARQAASDAQRGVQSAKVAAEQDINQSADSQKAAANQTIQDLQKKAIAGQTTGLDTQINNTKAQISSEQRAITNTNSQISDLQNQVKTLQGQQGQSQTFTGFHYPASAGVPGHGTDLTQYDRRYSFVSNPSDAQVQISDYTNLSPEIQKELTIYAAQLVNSFGREAWTAAGLTSFDPFMINDASLGEAKYAAQLYSQDNWSINQHGSHDVDALEKAAIRYGADAKDWDGTPIPAVDESATGQILPTGSRSTTLDKLKNAVFNAINSMLYDDLDNGNTHMMSLAQVWLEPDGWHFGHDCMGLAFDQLGQLHLVFAKNNSYSIDYSGPIYTATNYSYTPYLSSSSSSTDHSTQIANLNNQISSLQRTLASQQTTLQNLQNQLRNLQAQKNGAQFDISQLSPADQAAYRQAQAQLNTIEAWRSQQLANVNNSQAVKDAQSRVDDAQQNLQDTQQNLAEAQTYLAQMRTRANTANQALNQARTRVNDLDNQIQATRDQISQLQAQITQDRQALEDLQNGRQPSHPVTPTTPTNPADSGSTTTPSDGSNTTPVTPTEPVTPSNPTDEQPSTNQPSTNQPSASQPTNTDTTSQNGSTTGRQQAAVSGVDSQVVTNAQLANTVKSDAVAPAYSTREQYRAHQSGANALPQTGDENSRAIAALGVLAGMLGLGLGAKRQKNF